MEVRAQAGETVTSLLLLKSSTAAAEHFLCGTACAYDGSRSRAGAGSKPDPELSVGWGVLMFPPELLGLLSPGWRVRPGR